MDDEEILEREAGPDWPVFACPVDGEWIGPGDTFHDYQGERLCSRGCAEHYRREAQIEAGQAQQLAERAPFGEA